MPKKEVETSSEPWNVAKGYSSLKILIPLVELDKLIRIATYGSEHIEESLQMHPNIKTHYRVEAFKRLIDTIKEIIENADFALKKENRKITDNLDKELEEIEKITENITREDTNLVSNQNSLEIDEDVFKENIKKLRLIKKKLPDPLNKDGLIFPNSEEIDLEKMKEALIHGG